MITQREINVIADEINKRYRNFDSGGAVQFGIEEAVYAICEALERADRLPFEVTAFKRRCFAGAEVPS